LSEIYCQLAEREEFKLSIWLRPFRGFPLYLKISADAFTLNDFLTTIFGPGVFLNPVFARARPGGLSMVPGGRI
jgi:hypothetical protein